MTVTPIIEYGDTSNNVRKKTLEDLVLSVAPDFYFAFEDGEDDTSSSIYQRWLQQQSGPPQLPNYTSPALPDAIKVTPEPYQSDEVINAARAAAAANNCTIDGNSCMIPFYPPGYDTSATIPSQGVIFYGGALVDPRSYSPLADRLANRYGFPVVIPIFAHDLAFIPCWTGRFNLAQEMFPNVAKWVMVGHSAGGLGAVADLWTIMTNYSNRIDEVSGLVLLAADVNPNIGCGNIDFSNSSLPMAAVTASNDQILNSTRWEENKVHLPQKNTFFLDIQGGNHAGFGRYNDSERATILFQVDGTQIIDPTDQIDLTVAAVAQVASRAGALPAVDYPSPSDCSSTTSGGTTAATFAGSIMQGPWLFLLLGWPLFHSIFS